MEDLQLKEQNNVYLEGDEHSPQACNLECCNRVSDKYLDTQIDSYTEDKCIFHC